MVLSLSGSSQYVYLSYSADVRQSPSESLCLVVMLLLVYADNDVLVFF